MIYIRERALMMSDFRGEGGSKMIPKNRTLEGKNWTLGRMVGSKLSKNHQTSFMYVPLACSFSILFFQIYHALFEDEAERFFFMFDLRIHFNLSKSVN